MADQYKKCFVACPIGSVDSEARKRSDRLLKFILKPVFEELNYEVIRADQIQSAGNITTQVLQSLVDANIVVADLTDENPNVMYEIGIRHALQKPYIHLIKSGEKIPFDIFDVRTIFYDFDLEEVDNAKSQLKGQIKSIENGEWIAPSPITFVIPDSINNNEGDSERRMLVSLHEINNHISDNIIGIREDVEKIKTISEGIEWLKQVLSQIYYDKEKEREDRQQEKMLTLLGSLMGNAMQNPDVFKTLMEMGQQQNINNSLKEET